jgi:hypothetical protein
MTDDQPSIDSDWIDTDAPAEGQIVQVRSKNHHGFYIVPFPVEFRDGEWWNVLTGQKLDCFVAAWRPLNGLPDAPRPQRHDRGAGARVATIPLEDLSAENDK